MARLLAACSLLIFVPPLLPVFGAILEPPSRLFEEFGRWSELFVTTLSLVALTWVMSLPVGIWLGFRVGRMDRNRPFALIMLLALALIPIPVHVAAWQAVLTPGGAISDLGGWRPFASGLWAAAILSALAALPLAALCVASCVMRISPEVETHARTVGVGSFVWRRVYGPYLRQGIGWAIVATAISTSGDSTIADFCVLRTAAEEVYTAFVLNEGLPGAAWAALPTTLLTLVLAAFAVTRLGFPWKFDARPRIGSGRSPLAWCVLGSFAVVPVGRLIWQLGDGAGGFSAERAYHQWRSWADVRTGLMLGSAAESILVGFVAAVIALAWAWLGRTSSISRVFGRSLAIIWWALPAPVLGYGMKSLIAIVISVEEYLVGGGGLLREWLYDGPGDLPGIMMRLGRAFPWAALVIFPAVASLPKTTLELARVEGLSGRDLWRAWVRPALGGPVILAACLAGLVAFGEVSASRLVETPGADNYGAELFRQMHYGTSAAVAAAALHPWLLLFVSAAAFMSVLPRPTR